MTTTDDRVLQCKSLAQAAVETARQMETLNTIRRPTAMAVRMLDDTRLKKTSASSSDQSEAG